MALRPDLDPFSIAQNLGVDLFDPDTRPSDAACTPEQRRQLAVYGMIHPYLGELEPGSYRSWPTGDLVAQHDSLQDGLYWLTQWPEDDEVSDDMVARLTLHMTQQMGDIRQELQRRQRARALPSPIARQSPVSRPLLEQIKLQSDLVEIFISAGVDLRRSSPSAWKGLCPFHEERTPSFYVYTDKGFWICYGCQRKGDAIAAAQALHHLPFMAAVKHLAQLAGIPLDVPEVDARARAIARGNAPYRGPRRSYNVVTGRDDYVFSPLPRTQP